MAKDNSKHKILPQYPFAIFCEGVDEVHFMAAYLSYLVGNNRIRNNRFWAYDCGGNDEIEKNLSLYRMQENFNKLKGYLVIRDAEQDVRSAIDATKSILERILKCKVNNPGEIASVIDENLDGKVQKSGFLLFPGRDPKGQWRNGTLEDLCWDIISEIPQNEFSQSEVENRKGLIKNSITNYLDEITTLKQQKFIRTHKNKLHLFLSSTDKYVGMKPGEFAFAGGLDFDSPALAYIEQMLVDMDSDIDDNTNNSSRADL